jgi:hypothetical protein
MDLTSRVEFRDWTFVVDRMGDGFYLQASFRHETAVQHGRKWYISSHAIREEVVQTALKAVLTALEHEAREEFRFDGRAIYGPHFSLEALAEAADAHGPVRRAVPV